MEKKEADDVDKETDAADSQNYHGVLDADGKDESLDGFDQNCKTEGK